MTPELLKGLMLRVEVLAGTDLHDAAYSICELAGRAGIRINSSFNGVVLVARPGDKYQKLIDVYRKELTLQS